MGLLIALGVGLAIGLFFVFLNKKNEKNYHDFIAQSIENERDFIASRKFESPHKDYVFAFDFSNQKVGYFTVLTKKIYKFEDIVSVELVENNEVTMRKSTSRAIGRAVVGGVLAGGVGAIIGGVTGSSKEKTKHISLVVRITFRAIDSDPIELLYFGGDDIEDFYADRLKDANTLVKLINGIIDSVDNNSVNTSSATEVNHIFSVADELEKLLKLKEKGILTDDEFEKQKKAILESENSK